MNILKRREWHWAYIFYIIGFLTFISLVNIVPIRSVMPNILYSMCYLLFLGMGGMLILHDLLTERYLFQTSLWWVLLPCAGIMIINTVFNRVGGSFATDIKTTLWVVELITVCYSAIFRLGKTGFSKMLNWGVNIIVFIHSIAALVSVIQALYGVKLTIVARGASFVQGIRGGRLYGVYMSPGEPASCICILLILFLVGRWRTWYQKLYYGFCLGIIYYSFLLENTRASEVALLISGTCAAWIVGRKYLYDKKGKAILKEGLAVVFALLCLMGIYFVNKGTRIIVFQTVESLCDSSEELNGVSNFVDRKIASKDIRLDIWKAYITAYGEENRLLGYNKSGYADYLKEKYPECFSEDIKNFDVHSSYVDTLCRAGWGGVILLFGWLIFHMMWCLKYIIKHISLSKEETGTIIILFAMLTHGIFAETALWTFTEPEVMLFWLLAGGISFWAKGKIEESQC